MRAGIEVITRHSCERTNWSGKDVPKIKTSSLNGIASVTDPSNSLSDVRCKKKNTKIKKSNDNCRTRTCAGKAQKISNLSP